MNCASQYDKAEDKAWACKALADKALADDALAEGNLGRKTYWKRQCMHTKHSQAFKPWQVHTLADKALADKGNALTHKLCPTAKQ